MRAITLLPPDPPDDVPPLAPFVPPDNEYGDAPLDDQSRDAKAQDTTASATDPKDMARRRHRKRYEESEIDKFWRASLATAPGRSAIWEFLEAAHIRESRFACGPNGFPQPEATWFELGQKSMGEWLRDKLMQIDLALYGMMLKEHHPDFMDKKTRRNAR